MSRVLFSEIGMPVARLMTIDDAENGIKLQVRWKGLNSTDDTLEPIIHIYEDVPDLLLKLLQRQNNPRTLAGKARPVLGLRRGV